ncbi:TadE-like protein [Roseivivax jejudonensis]|uniref:TadE-like protein n=1 Tax=Roseivivax jejudonensis TaxID=1529041 RepID=A0A1X6ZB06_9RHOB|nr:TadE/TadG family type IV pilus assembly protein [Roseivivax jejudonensis]SLN46373.1 TadE-like protein [Roseivivax jejudonensis]
MIRALARHAARFRADQSGAALVEFALILPSALVLLGVSVEGARTFWSYQTTVTGVRDAARFVSRAADSDLCATGGSLAAWEPRLLDIVRTTATGATPFPVDVSVDAVTADLACHDLGLRGGTVGVATVTATLTIRHPFRTLFSLAGGTSGGITATVRDSARLIGA